MILTPHGFCFLMTGKPLQQAKVYEALLVAGFAPWDRNGLPLFVVLESGAGKAQWFEAGYLAGAKVPLFAIGSGNRFRERHLDTLGRLGGWAACLDREADLIGQLERRGIMPSAWDLENSGQFLQWLKQKQKEQAVTA